MTRSCTRPPAPTPTVDAGVILEGSSPSEGPQRSLILGYNARTRTVLRELDEYVEPGSKVVLVADRPAAPVEGLKNLTVEIRRSSTTDRAALEAIGLAAFDHVIVMAYGDDLDAQRADARTLVTLLHLRDIADRTGLTVPIVSEMLDDGNRELAQVTKVDDVIVSDQLISLLLTQIAENPHLAEVFGELFSATGSEVYLRDALSYCTGAATFATFITAAARRGETAIGYRSGEQVVINPPKADRYAPRRGDRLIVLAES